MPDSSNGPEPQADETRRTAPSVQALRDANQCFKMALNYVERLRWRDASASLRDALTLVPGYPQAAELLALTEDVEEAESRGEDGTAQMEALRTYVEALRAGRESQPVELTPPPPPTGVALGLPWAPDAPEVVKPAVSTYADHIRAASARSASQPAPIPLRRLSPHNPLDYARVLWWSFIRPARIKAYARAGQSDSLQRVAGPLASTLLWLPLAMPVLAGVLGLIPGTLGIWLGWFALVLGALWLLSGWLTVHNSAPLALLIASATAVFVVPILMASAGLRTGALIWILFLLLAGVAAGIAGVSAHRSAIHLALGMTYVVTLATVFRTYTFIAPIVNAYVAGFILGDIGGPILIAIAVIAAGLVAMGVTYAMPLVGTYIIAFVMEAVLEDTQDPGAPILGMAALTGVIALYGALLWISFFGGWQVVR